jgi:ABC-type Zn uptake system ZnuABC Zn-binding protein ZnuA
MLCRLIMRMILILLTAAAMLTLQACGEEGGDSPKLTVAASTAIVADVTEQIAGARAEVVQIIPDTASPHDYQPSAQDRQRFAEADLVVLNGAGLDAGLPVEDADAPVWELAEHVPSPLPFGEAEHAGGGEEGAHSGEEARHEEEQHHAEGSIDPHVWMDPRRVAAALPSLAAALGDVDEAGADGYHRNALEAARRLRAVDRQIADELKEVPNSRRDLVTSHDALSYFADRYGLEVIATAFPATGADAEPTAAALADVIDAVRSSEAPALFAEETDDPEALESVAEETGAIVVDELVVEAPGPAGSYEDMLRRDAQLIASALDAR